MKYGVVYFEQTNNIGDDIQAYAASLLLPQLDEIIDRETIGFWHSNSREKTAVIMNAWYMYNELAWPPSNDIIPLNISMHFTKGLSPDGYSYLDGAGRDWLKLNSPIGCRDKDSLDILNKRGIECYFSGCLTLTLPRQTDRKTDKRTVFLVDISKKAEKHARVLAANQKLDVCVRTHAVDYRRPNTPNWENRKQRVQELLNLYGNACLVITSRLHCALPCIAIGTPVLLLKPGNSVKDKRIASFYNFLNTASDNLFCDTKMDFRTVKNPENHLELRAKLLKDVESFVEKVSSKVYQYPHEISHSDRDKWILKRLGREMEKNENELRADFTRNVSIFGKKQLVFALGTVIAQLAKKLK